MYLINFEKQTEKKFLQDCISNTDFLFQTLLRV